MGRNSGISCANAPRSVTLQCSMEPRVCLYIVELVCTKVPLTSLSLLTLCTRSTLQLLVKTDKPPACCHMELITRTGGNKRQFNFNTNKETFQIPPYKTPGGTRSLRVFALKQIHGGSLLGSSVAAVTPGPAGSVHEGQGWNHPGPGPSKAGLVFLAR